MVKRPPRRCGGSGSSSEPFITVMILALASG
jgi:hypothetical protein